MAEATPAKLILVDGSGYIFRAFFGLPPMTRGDGTPVNAVFGFSSMLFKLMQDMPDDPIIVVFDAGRHSFRNDIYAEYKANRQEPPPELVPQFPLVRDAARAFGLPVLELAGFEADDIIATLTEAGRSRDQAVTIVSSDKDLMQLVGDNVVMWDPMKSIAIGREQVIDKFGVGPELVRDCLALAGDTSDNVPGVPGIGVKTAAQLLTQFGSLDALLAQAGTIKQPKRRQALIDNAEMARLSQTLVSLKADVPLEDFELDAVRRTDIDPAPLLEFLQANNFKSLIGRIDKVADHVEQERAASPQTTEYKRIDTMDALGNVLSEAKTQGVLAIDTETTSLNVAMAELVGISLAVTGDTGYYIPLAHIDDFSTPQPRQLDLRECLDALRPALTDPTILKIGHNLKYDMGVLRKYGVTIAPFDDTMLLSYVVYGNSHGHGMDELANRYLDHQTIPYSEVCGSGKSQISFAQAPIDKAVDYAAEDALVTLRLWQILKPALIEARLTTVYEHIERPLAPILADLETNGIKVDADILRRLSAGFNQKMAELEVTAHELVGHSFNLGSPKQLGEILFDEMGLPGGKKTKSGNYGTNVEVLESLAAQGHDLPQTILDWRQLQKLTRTYTEKLVDDIVPQTGRVHTSFAMASTSTGRLSSTDPNLQNIPIRTEEGRRIREAFVADDGKLLLSADYSQIELRVLAHIAGIDVLKDAFAHDTDIHKVTASQMFDIPVDEIDADYRRKAKTINYGIIYGIGAFGLAQRLGIPQKEAKDYIEAYFEQYPGIKDYMEATKQAARDQGYVTTLFNRRCYMPEINAKMPTRRNYAERQAINAPIQGTAADIMKRAMIALAAKLNAGNASANVLLQVHDELLLEVPEADIDQTSALVREAMMGAAALSVPLVVDVGVGGSWHAAH